MAEKVTPVEFVPVLTERVVVKAAYRTIRFITFMMAQGLVGNRTGFRLVVSWIDRYEAPRQLIWEIGSLDYSKHSYGQIVDSKAALTKHFKCSTDEILLAMRSAGDTIYPGSEWSERYRCAVSGTGFPAYIDKLACQFFLAQVIDILDDAVDLGEPADGLKVDGDFLIPA